MLRGSLEGWACITVPFSRNRSCVQMCGIL